MKKSLLICLSMLLMGLVMGQSNFQNYISSNEGKDYLYLEASRIAQSEVKLDSLVRKKSDGEVDHKLYYSYDSLNRLVYWNEKYDASEWSETSGIRMSFAYDSLGRSIADTTREGDFYAAYKIRHYSEDGLLVSRDHFRLENDNWKFRYRYRYQYGNNGQLESVFEEFYDSTKSDWESTERRDYYFDTYGNLSEEIVYDKGSEDSLWKVRNWRSRVVYEFDVAGGVISMEEYNWSYSDSWEKESKTVYHVDTDYEIVGFPNKQDPENFLFYKIDSVQFFSFENDEWKNDGVSYIYYSEIENTLSVEEGESSLLLSLYPNPTSGQLTISLEASFGPSSYQLMSLNGEILQEGKISNEAILNISDLANGFYVVHLTNEKGERITRKFLKN